MEKLLLKIEPSEITSFFYNNFFPFGGGGEFSHRPPPGYATVLSAKMNAKIGKSLIMYNFLNQDINSDIRLDN